MDGFGSARLKIGRAQELRDVVELEAQNWMESSDPRLVVSVEEADNPLKHDLVVRMEGLAPVSGGLLLAVDDVLHHARSALDHAIWQLVADEGGQLKKQAFPVLPERKDTSLSASIAGTSSSVWAVVDRYQPYHQPPPNTFKNSTTQVLHRLDVVSKHRSIVAIQPWSTTMQIQVFEGIENRQVTWHQPDALDDSQPPVVLSIQDVSEDYVAPEGWFGVSKPSLWIADGDDYVGGPLVEVLSKVVRWAGKIVDALEAVRPSA
ncbi:hypothetical protein [Cellulomonas sp. P5_C5]